MKKNITLFIAICLIVNSAAFAQVAINTDGTQPNASAMLDIKSIVKGVLMPRVTSVQKAAIPSPADGLLVYDTDTKSLWYYKNGTGWQEISSAANLALPYTASLSSAGSLFGITNTGNGAALEGKNSSTTASIIAIKGTVSSTAPGGFSSAVRGINNGTGGLGIGVWGSQAGSGWGVYGNAVDGIGVYGNGTGSGYGVYANGSSGAGLGATSNTGVAGNFTIVNNANTSNVITANTTGSGNVLNASTTGSGYGVYSSSTGGTGVYGATGNIGSAGLLGDNTNGGEAVTGRTSSSGSATGAVVGRNDGPGYGVRGFVATDNSGNGIGVFGQVGISSSTGRAGRFENLNSANSSNTLEAVTNGPGVIADHSQGNAGNFFNNNTNGVGAGVCGQVNSIFGNNGTAGVYGVATGTGGYGGYFEHTNSSGFGMALEAVTSGQGVVAHFETVPAANAQPTLQVITAGTGSGSTISNTNSNNTSNILQVTTNGPGVIADHSQGNAGNFFINNTNGVGAGVRGEVNSIFGNNGTAGVYGVASGTGGYGGYFEHSNSSGFGHALDAFSSGQGVVSHFETVSTSNSQPTLQVVTAGTGSGTTISNSNDNNTSNILQVTTNGPGVIADHSQGNAGNFFINNTSGVGAGVRGEVNSIFGNNGTAGVYGVASGTGGYGGYFEHSNSSGFGITLQAISYGQGTVLVADNEGSSGDLAKFQTGGSNKARIDITGKGFFDGGTQSSGADLAEAFDVEGNYTDYEPGDVLEISATADRTVIKCSTPYSTLVAGVYATKPGVLLTEENVNTDLTGKVPMGVVGVIPTKVCDENGPIQRGDLLVTSSKAGYAMKADLAKVKPGQVIGKALQEFSGTDGKIKVLVNVR